MKIYSGKTIVSVSDMERNTEMCKEWRGDVFMNTKRIITIGRQFGSGGREVGQKLAERLGIPYYDRELLIRTAKESGLSEAVLKNYDERPRSLLFTAATDPYAFGMLSAGVDESIENRALNATMKTIWAIEKEGPCVIIGRAADYFLKNPEEALKVFIYAPMDIRIKTVMAREDLTEDKARKLILQTDKKRAAFYNFYTMKEWGAMASYDICLNSGMIGVDGAVDTLEKIVKL